MLSQLFPQPPNKTFAYNEILVKYAEKIPEIFASLTSEERIFVYFLYRASIPGDRICCDQLHRHGSEVIDLFTKLVSSKDQVLTIDPTSLDLDFDPALFMQECETYLAYLICNNGFYFNREHANNKRTPDKLKMVQLNFIHLEAVLKHLHMEIDLSPLQDSVFNPQYEPTCTVQGSIEESASNFYEKGFTEQDFKNIPLEEQCKINAYFYKDEKGNPKSIPYSVTGKYSTELKISIYWMEKAFRFAERYPNLFDKNLIQSLSLMIEYLTTGNEETFKKQCVEWLQSQSRIDYCAGFQEVYDDPKGYRGRAQWEVTMKILDMKKLNNLIPQLEQQFPIPKEFQRDLKSTTNKQPAPTMNASLNIRLFGSGGLGMFSPTAAYCLPNYEEIREKAGSKQIIYPSMKSIGMRTNKSLWETLFHSQSTLAWHRKFDPDHELPDDIWNVSCILHETCGHGSGKADFHTFVKGDPLTIDGEEYKIGDKIQVTSTNFPQFMFGYQNAIEEMRAEIISLYVSIYHLDELLEIGLMNRWKGILNKQEMIERFILGMADVGLRRYLQQSEGATEISGAHALANCTIFHYLVLHGGIELVVETVDGIHEILEEKQVQVVELKIKDLDLAKTLVKTLLIQVQQIKSTADGLMAKTLIESYGKKIFFPQHLKTLKENRKLIIGNLKGMATLYPIYQPILNESGDFLDVTYTWPTDIFDQHKKLSLMLNNLI